VRSWPVSRLPATFAIHVRPTPGVSVTTFNTAPNSASFILHVGNFPHLLPLPFVRIDKGGEGRVVSLGVCDERCSLHHLAI